MSSQESVRESRVSNPAPEPRANSDADHFGPATEEEMEADLKRIDAMEEDQEATSHLQPGFMLEELQSSAIPNSVIPPNARFLSYENMIKTVAFPPRLRTSMGGWSSSRKSKSSRKRIVS